MKPELHISLIQIPLAWENKAANFKAFEQQIASLDQSADLIVLPEMFNTGFTMNARDMSENMTGSSVQWLASTAKNTNAVVTGSLIIEDGGNFFNRLVWMRPDGSYLTYDKRHLFRMAREDEHFSGGNELITAELHGWKIRPLICYDLRFPVWSRNRYSGTSAHMEASYDVLIYVANWPSARVVAWDSLLRARAVENQAYCLGLNRTGRDANEIDYVGHSAVISAKGDYLIEPVSESSSMLNIRLSASELTDFRAKFPQGLDADRFEILDP